MSKPKLTPKVEEILSGALAMGAPKNLACDLAGISRETLRLWLADPANSKLTKKVNQSSAAGRMALLKKLRDIVNDKDTPAHVKAQTCMWLLERVDR